MAKIPSVLVVDPDLDTRSDIKKAVARAYFGLAGESGFGIDAITMARSVEPDVVLLSAEEPMAAAFQTLESLGNALPETPVVVYSSVSNLETIRKLVLGGARDLLQKPVASADLAKSIYAVLEAEEKRRMRHARQTEDIPAQGIVITVASLKGGVGKTTLSVNLAIALRQKTGQSVALLDAEPNYGDVATVLDIDSVPFTQSLAHAARRADTLDRTSVMDYMMTHASGISVLPTATQLDSWQTIQPSQVQQLVRLIAQTQDYVIVDTPGGLSPVSTAALEAASLALLVTTPDITSLKDTMLALHLFETMNIDKQKVKIIMNHTSSANGVHNEDVKLVLEHDVFWNLPYDSVVYSCSQLGQPVITSYPDSKIAQGIAGLATALSGGKRTESASRFPFAIKDLMPRRAAGG